MSGRESRLDALEGRVARLRLPERVARLKPGSIVGAMTDPQVFGQEFGAASWAAWRAFLSALFGLRMDAAGLHVFQQHTGRTSPPSAPAREAWVIVGRRGGKSRIAALVAVFLACFRRYRLAPGERGTVMVIAADRRQARVVFGYVAGLLDLVPALRQLVAVRRQESIDLATGISIEIHTASFRAVRGYTLLGVVADECAFWHSDESANPDTEILNALRPGMATVPGALLLAISTPYARRGEVWKAYDQHYGHEDDPVLVWRAETRAMNPTVDPAVIAEAYASDPIAAAAEYGAEFRRDVEAFLTPEAVEAAVVPGRRELAPDSTRQYTAFADPSGGAQDSFTLAVAHLEGERAILDAVREVRPPFSPDGVVAEYATLLKAYRLREVTGDYYGGEWPRERFGAHGISYRRSERPKSDIYKEALAPINAGRVALLDVVPLKVQLLGLERRVARSGKDSIDHAPGGRDDLANSAAGALVRALDMSTRLPGGFRFTL